MPVLSFALLFDCVMFSKLPSLCYSLPAWHLYFFIRLFISYNIVQDILLPCLASKVLKLFLSSTRPFSLGRCLLVWS